MNVCNAVDLYAVNAALFLYIIDQKKNTDSQTALEYDTHMRAVYNMKEQPPIPEERRETHWGGV